MIILAKGYITDDKPSMLDKAIEYASTSEHKTISVLGFDSRLYELNKLTNSIADCIIFDNVQLITEPVQVALTPLIIEASKDKDIILLVSKERHLEVESKLTRLADKTIELEPNASTLEKLGKKL